MPLYIRYTFSISTRQVTGGLNREALDFRLETNQGFCPCIKTIEFGRSSSKQGWVLRNGLLPSGTVGQSAVSGAAWSLEMLQLKSRPVG